MADDAQWRQWHRFRQFRFVSWSASCQHIPLSTNYWFIHPKYVISYDIYFSKIVSIERARTLTTTPAIRGSTRWPASSRSWPEVATPLIGKRRKIKRRCRRRRRRRRSTSTSHVRHRRRRRRLRQRRRSRVRWTEIPWRLLPRPPLPLRSLLPLAIETSLIIISTTSYPNRRPKSCRVPANSKTNNNNNNCFNSNSNSQRLTTRGYKRARRKPVMSTVDRITPKNRNEIATENGNIGEINNRLHRFPTRISTGTITTTSQTRLVNLIGCRRIIHGQRMLFPPLFHPSSST